MPISVKCPKCGLDLRCPESLVGQSGKCPKCLYVIQIAPEDSGTNSKPIPEKVSATDTKRPPTKQKPRFWSPEEIVRHYASQHKRKEVLKKIGNFAPKHIAKARATFARGMAEEEVPLIFYDLSFLQNGRAGVLVTDRAVYTSSGGPKRTLLSDIESVIAEIPNLVEATFNHTSMLQLRMNGQVILAQVARRRKPHFEFLAAVIGDLSRSAHRDHHRSETTTQNATAIDSGQNMDSAFGPSESSQADLVHLVASSVYTGQVPEVIVANLIKKGVDRQKAQMLVDQMSQINSRSQRTNHMIQMVIGIFMGIAGFIGAVVVGVQRWPDSYRFTCIGITVLGVGQFILGAYNLNQGSSQITVDQLISEWNRKASPDFFGEAKRECG